MFLLLDTHVLIWALENNPKLTDNIRNLIVDLDNTIFVSTASIWEIAIKKSVKKDFQYDPKEIVNLCSKVGFRFVGIGLEEILNLNKLKIMEGEVVNNDPFDKLLISQAKVNNMKLITHDSLIKKYAEECIIGF